ncbi:MAG: hypothetical protein ACYSRQ_03870, partial [Planctomycetota bacterium]
MTKYYSLILTLTFVLSGCSGKTASNKTINNKRIDTPAGMIQYLEDQRLPAMVSAVEWNNKYGPGLKVNTQHYEIHTTLLEPLMLRQVPGFMESAYRAYNSQLPEPVETTSKFKIYLFSQRQQWEDFTDDFTGPQASIYKKIQAGAYYLNG